MNPDSHIPQHSHGYGPFIDNPHPHLAGRVQVQCLQSGLTVKSAQIEARAPVHLDDVSFAPDLRVVLLLRGHTHLRIGSHVVDLQASQGAAGLWLPVWYAQSGQKWFEQGECQDELVLFVGREWLAGLAADLPSVPSWLAGGGGHLQARPFAVTPYMCQLVQEWRDEPALPPLLHRLHRESLALKLFAAVCRQLLLQDGEAGLLRREAQKRINTLTGLLHSGRADNWTLAQMAAHCRSNISTLQRHFQQCHGVGIWHYLRRLKLERAYQALQSGASVARAAEVAGYQHIESFSKAFKQQYGCNPVQIKVLA